MSLWKNIPQGLDTAPPRRPYEDLSVPGSILPSEYRGKEGFVSSTREVSSNSSIFNYQLAIHNDHFLFNAFCLLVSAYCLLLFALCPMGGVVVLGDE
jgi:hypothetical protein